MIGQRDDAASTDAASADHAGIATQLPETSAQLDDAPAGQAQPIQPDSATGNHSNPNARLRRALFIALPVGLVAALVSAVAGLWVVSHFGPQPPDGSFVLDTPGVYNSPSDTSLHNHQADGKPLPTIELVDEGGQKVVLSITRPTIINVWFSTCAPCGQELPAFAAIDDEFGERIDVIGVNPFDTQSAMETFAADRGVSYRLLRDPTSEFINTMGIVAFPVTLFVNSNGVIVRQLGTVDVADLQDNIAELFPEVTTSSGAQPTGEHAGHGVED